MIALQATPHLYGSWSPCSWASYGYIYFNTLNPDIIITLTVSTGCVCISEQPRSKPYGLWARCVHRRPK